MTSPNGLMSGKRGLIMGVANNRSIAWGIAQKLREHGAELALTFQGEALEKRVRPLADSLGSTLVLECDVTRPEQLDATFAALEAAWGSIDFVVHAIAYSDKDQLKGRYVDTTAENFAMTMGISCFSFTAVCQRAEKLMPNGGSLLTLTYYGAEKVLPHYNVMGVAKAALEATVRYLAVDLGPSGVRVNAVSAGAVNTLAARGVAHFRDLMRITAERSPLKRTVETEEVGRTCLFLASDLSTGITGETMYVDAGFNITAG